MEQTYSANDERREEEGLQLHELENMVSSTRAVAKDGDDGSHFAGSIVVETPVCHGGW